MNEKASRSRNRSRVLVAIVASWMFHVPLAAAQDPQCVRVKPGVRVGETIGLEYGNDMPRRVVADAIAYWKSCDSYLRGFPSLLNGRPGMRTLRLHFLPGNSGSPKCGSFSGSTIVIHGFASDARGRIRRCGSPARLLAHELGHALGLSDCPERPACELSLMSNARPDARHQPTITKNECAAVDERWLTTIESGERVAAFDLRENDDLDSPILIAGHTPPEAETREPPLPY